MATSSSSLTATCTTPGSLQLRWALSGAGKRMKNYPASVVVRSRVKWSRVVCCAAERSGGDRSWAGSADSDWFSGSEDDKGAGYPKKNWLKGYVGAGVAGIVIVGGLAFATLSLSKKNASRLKQQLEPLTAQQEVMLASDYQSDEPSYDGTEVKKVNQDNMTRENETGIPNVAVPSLEASEDPNEKNGANNKTFLVHHDDATPDFIDSNMSSEEGLKYELAVAESSHESSGLEGTDVSLAQGSHETSSEAANSLVTAEVGIPSSGLEGTDVSLAQGSHETSSEAANSFVTAEVGIPSLSNYLESRHNIDQQEGLHDETSLSGSPSPAFITPPSEPVVLDASVDSDMDTFLEADSEPGGSIGDVVSPLSEETINPTKTQKGSVDSYVGVNNSDEESSTSPYLSEPAYQSADEAATDDLKEMNKGNNIFESTNPENSFSSAGIPAPARVSVSYQLNPGKVLIPAEVDQIQGQALAALQALKVIEADVQPTDLCTRREYARWLVSASSALSRNSVSKVYPAMYIENITELAFDDITPVDPDFASIQGLAEAGLISSKLSRHDLLNENDTDDSLFNFVPESHVSRQDLVSWKMAIEKKRLPQADRKTLYQISGFIDAEKIDTDACPALVADLSAGEHGIISHAFGYTKLFQPGKPVTKAQAAIALATGEASDVVGEELARIEAESMADNAVVAHSALVAQVEKDINASFANELSIEREKIAAVERMAEDARRELEMLRAEREQENLALVKERASIESEMEIFSRLRREMEEQLQSLTSNKAEIAFEKERINKLRADAETENQEIERLQYELEVERKALSMARAWAEDEAKRATEQAKALEEARDRWEKHGIKVVVDSSLREETTAEATWVNAGKQFSAEDTISRGETLVNKLKAMAGNVGEKSRALIRMLIQKILSLISVLREQTSKAGHKVEGLKDAALSRADKLKEDIQQRSTEFGVSVKEGAKRVAGDCREGVDKITQKFKT